MLKRNVFRVFIVISSIAFLQVAATIILARHLPKAEMGLYRLILTIVDLGTLVSLRGIDQAFVRFFSSPGIYPAEYDWKSFLKSFFSVSLIIISIIAFISSFIYRFPSFVSLATVILMVMLTSIFIFSSFVRARKKYGLSIFLSRMNFLIFFFLLAMLYIFKKISLINAIFYYTLAVVLAGCAVIYYAFVKIPSGKKLLPFSVTKTGIYYFGMALSIGLILQTSYLFIGKMLSYKDLAVYAVITSIMRLFEFTQDSTYYVLAPYLNTRSNVPAKKLLFTLLSLATGIALIYLFFGKIAVHIFFKGLYDEGVYLLPFFIGIGVVKTLYIFPASIIGGRTSEITLRNQFYLTGAAALLNICLTYAFITKWSLAGAAGASLLTWSILFIVALYGTKKHIIYNESGYGTSM